MMIEQERGMRGWRSLAAVKGEEVGR
jgi:hypothetical protein